MPDVVRSDSQRSDTSLRPRVSFNRDVHVKRIVPRVGPTALETNESHYSNVPSARKNHTKRPKKEYIEKRKVNYNPKPEENSEKFYTLPRTRKEYKEINDAIVNSKPPKKPQRIFATEYKPDNDKNKTATLNSSKNKKTKQLNRSASDAAYSKTKFSEKDQQHKKQLTPIAEVPPHGDFFSNISDNFKENNNCGSNTHKNKVSKKENRTLREKNNVKNNKKNKIVVIDIDKAEDISNQSKKSRLKDSFFAKKFFTNKRNRKNDNDVDDILLGANLKTSPQSENSEEKSDNSEFSSPIPSVSRLKKSYENSEMIHSSQKPADRPPLTKGRTVDLMVRRLNKDTSSPPPKPNIMVTPNLINQHNNNQPFSYTRGLSPERYTPDDSFTTNPSGVPIIYAQVVCNNDRNGTAKQTIHTAFSKRYSLSDSDEGLGNDEVHRPTYTRFGDEIKSKNYRVPINNNCDIHLDFCDCNNLFNETSQRGCGDGMEEAKRSDGFSENITNSIRTRRDLLESRIAKKIHDTRGTEVKFDSLSSSPSTLMRDQNNKKYGDDLERRVLYYGTDESKSYDSQINESENRKLFSKTLYKSTPEIYRKSNEQLSNNYTYHNSLQRDIYKQANRTRTEKDKLGNSDLSPKKSYIYSDYNHIESEDEGFASSLLIASEKQHTEDGIKRVPKKEYDSDLNFSAEDEVHHYLDEIDKKISKSYNDQFVPRERSIDDGSHFDPRIDKEVTLKQSTLKRNVNKPPKPEKKSSLEKVKKLFNRDTKKKSKGKNEMVREESLLARYTEYKGSSDNLDNKDTYSESKDYYYGTRKRAKTPSVNSSQSQDTAETRKSNNSYTSWFKSLDRISQKHKKNKEKSVKANGSPKNLRFFGDTESEAGELSRNHPGAKTPKNRISQSSRELHNISEEISNPELLSKRDSGYKSMLNISDRNRDYRTPGRSQKPPIFPISKSSHDISRSAEDRRRKYEQSSLESSTEGDGSQQSQRSIVYLHAATVGDIPDPSSVKYGQKAASKEELSDSSRIQPQSKTLSRSFSVLAPWRPRYIRENRYINYYQPPTSTEKPSRKENNKPKNQKSDTLQKKKTFTLSRSKENLIRKQKDETPKSSTLYKKREHASRENSRYVKDDTKISAKSQSFESLRKDDNNTLTKRGTKDKKGDISRSVSMPKDPERLAGWYKNNKKSEYKPRV